MIVPIMCHVSHAGMYPYAGFFAVTPLALVEFMGAAGITSANCGLPGNATIVGVQWMRQHDPCFFYGLFLWSFAVPVMLVYAGVASGIEEWHRRPTSGTPKKDAIERV